MHIVSTVHYVILRSISRHLRLVPIIFFGLVTFCHGSSDIRVTFINPDSPDNFFWRRMTQFMQAAAKDLNIDLNVIYGNAERFLTKQKTLAAIESSKPGDYLVFVFQYGSEAAILDSAEQAGVYSIAINTDPSQETKHSIRHPRQHYRFWLSHLSPNDQKVGFDLADYLIRQLIQNGQQQPVEMIAISGTQDSSAAIERNLGLSRFVQHANNVTLHQITWARWQTDISEFQTQRLLKRYPQTCAIWTASDGMAKGAYQATLSLEKSNCEYFQIGGVDWSEWGLNAVRDGSIATTVGGHFMEGAWALVLIHDHHNLGEQGSIPTRIKTPMQLIHKGNYHLYEKVLEPENWSRINFRNFSQKHSEIEFSYNFSTEAVRLQLIQSQTHK